MKEGEDFWRRRDKYIREEDFRRNDEVFLGLFAGPKVQR